jgi:hypothetical protein
VEAITIPAGTVGVGLAQLSKPQGAQIRLADSTSGICLCRQVYDVRELAPAA